MGHDWGVAPHCTAFKDVLLLLGAVDETPPEWGPWFLEKVPPHFPYVNKLVLEYESQHWPEQTHQVSWLNSSQHHGLRAGIYFVGADLDDRAEGKPQRNAERQGGSIRASARNGGTSTTGSDRSCS